MNNHLNEEQLATLVLGESDRATGLHLEECCQCRGEMQALRGAIGTWVEDIARGSGTSEVFWRRQKEAIDARLTRGAFWRPWNHLAWATATLTLVLVAGAVFHQQPAPAVKKAPVDDNALLLSVHNSVSSDVPQALEPVTLLTQEIDRAEEVRPTLSN